MFEQRILVIGGGPAGLTAALGAADAGGRAVLVERRDRLGGTPIHSKYAKITPDLRDAEEAMNELTSKVASHPGVEVRTGTQVKSVSGTVGAFRVTLEKDGVSGEETVGAIVVATGFEHFDPGRETQAYGYYQFPDVITLTEAEAMLKEGHFVRPSDGKVPETVAFVQCVGSRDRRIGNQHCSKVCCGVASKQAIEIRQHVPGSKVFIYYIDLRAFGFWEDELYWKAQEEYGVAYIRGVITEVLARDSKLVVKGEDTTMGRPVETPVDMVILSTGMVPGEGTVEAAATLGLSRESHGFIGTVGGPLDPVSTGVAGIFVAGAAAGPATLEDSVSTGTYAAVKAVAVARAAGAAAEAAVAGPGGA